MREATDGRPTGAVWPIEECVVKPTRDVNNVQKMTGATHSNRKRQFRLGVFCMVLTLSLSAMKCSSEIAQEIPWEKIKNYYVVKEEKVPGRGCGSSISLGVAVHNASYCINNWVLSPLASAESSRVKALLSSARTCRLGIFWYGGGRSSGLAATMIALRDISNQVYVFGVGELRSETGTRYVIRRLTYSQQGDYSSYRSCWLLDNANDHLADIEPLRETPQTLMNVHQIKND